MKYQRIFEPLLFIGIVVFLAAVAEWQNNVLMNLDIRGWLGYRDTLIFYALFLGIPAYVSFWWLRVRLSVPKLLLSFYLLWGFIGLMIEWFLIGHFPWSYAVQIGLVTYWAGVFAAPLIFLLPEGRPVRHAALRYMVLGSIMMFVLSLGVQAVTPNKDLLLLSIIVSWFFFYAGILHFLLRMVGLGLTRFEYVLLAFVVPLVEILSLQFGLVPLKFVVFVAAVLYMVWRVRGRYQVLRGQGG